LLELCRSADPAEQVQDWGALRQEFDRLDARYHFHRAYELACRLRGRNRAEVEGPLVQALALDTALASAAAPLVALLCLPEDGKDLDTFAALRDQFLKQAETLIGQTPVGGEPVRPELRRRILAEAIRCLKRALDLLPPEDSERKVWDMTRGLWAGFRPVLRHGRPQDIDVVGGFLDEWQQQVCQLTADPRNPFWRCRRDVDASRCLAKARACLDVDRQGALAFVRQALESGLSDGGQARIAVRLYALALPLEGPEAGQCRVLDALEQRAENWTPEIGSLQAESFDAWIREEVLKLTAGG
jgi:hypothetical protein